MNNEHLKIELTKLIKRINDCSGDVTDNAEVIKRDDWVDGYLSACSDVQKIIISDFIKE